MTAIIGLVHQGTVYLGGDSGATDGRDVSELRPDAKVWQHGGYVMGVSGSFRQADVMHYVFEPPTWNVTQRADPLPFMIREFVPALRECLEDSGLRAPKDDENENPLPGQVLVGIGDQLFNIEADYQVGRTMDGFQAIGSGDLICMGVMHTLLYQQQHLPSEEQQSPEGMIFTALGTAEHYVVSVRAPFMIVDNR